MRKAKGIIDDQSMLLQRNKEKLEQEKNLNERLRKRNQKKKDKEKDDLLKALKKNGNQDDMDEEMERLLRDARGMIDNQDVLNNRMKEISQQQDDLLDKLSKRKQKRQKEIDAGDNDKTSKKAKDYQNDIDELMNQAEKLMLDRSMANKQSQETEL